MTDSASPAPEARVSPELRQRASRLATRAIVAMLMVLPTLGAALWSCHPALRAAAASISWQMGSARKLSSSDLPPPKELARLTQRHFLDYGVYIPLEDIVIDEQGSEERDTLLFLMRKTCGLGKIYIWVPFKFRLPIIGDKVVEWCLKHR